MYTIESRRSDLSAQFRRLARKGALSFDDLYLWCMGRRHDVGAAEIAAKLEAMLRNNPEDRTIRLALAENLRRLGRLAEAETALASSARRRSRGPCHPRPAGDRPRRGE